MSLYRAETRRLTKRRFTRFSVLLVLVVLGLVAAGIAVTNHKVTPAAVAAAQAEAEHAFQEQTRAAQQVKARCAERPADYPEGCDAIWTPTEDQFQAEDYLGSQFDFRANFPAMMITLAALLALVAFVIGASFVGAEWNSGGMMNLLLWRPQRLRVLSTKLSALLVWLTGLSAVTGAVWTGICWVIAMQRGTTARMTPGVWQSIGLLGLRGLALVLVAGAIGFGVASIGRHTAAALGTAIGVIVVFQFGLGVVLRLAHARFADLYLLPTWIAAWMDKSFVVTDDYAPCGFSADGCEPSSYTLTWQTAGAVFAAVAITIVGAAMWTIRKRDIT